jgi:hypothetical protein
MMFDRTDAIFPPFELSDELFHERCFPGFGFSDDADYWN